MNTLAIILATIGFIVVIWWVIGVILLAYFAKIYVQPGAPLMPKIMTVLVCGFVLPWLAMVNGRIPIAVVAENNPESEKKVERWIADNCPCGGCRRRRGEEEK